MVVFTVTLEQCVAGTHGKDVVRDALFFVLNVQTFLNLFPSGFPLYSPVVSGVACSSLEAE